MTTDLSFFSAVGLLLVISSSAIGYLYGKVSGWDEGYEDGLYDGKFSVKTTIRKATTTNNQP